MLPLLLLLLVLSPRALPGSAAQCLPNPVRGRVPAGPAFYVHYPQHPSNTAVIYLSGGSFLSTTPYPPLATFFTDINITYVSLEYTIGNTERMFQDVASTIAYVRQVLRFNTVGTIGLSAGGYLAILAATGFLDRHLFIANFAITCGAVVTMSGNYTHIPSHDALLGKDATPATDLHFSLQFWPIACPTLAYSAADDTVVNPIGNTLALSNVTFFNATTGGHNLFVTPAFKSLVTGFVGQFDTFGGDASGFCQTDGLDAIGGSGKHTPEDFVLLLAVLITMLCLNF